MWMEPPNGSFGASIHIERQSLFCEYMYVDSRHYHSEMVENFGDKTVYVTPSTQMQIDPNISVFCLSSAAPGWRVIEWGENFLETKVYFSNTP